MAQEFHLPDIGEGLAEATVLTWYVDVGEAVGLDEPLVEVETDKAVVDIPSPVAGVVLHHGAAAGEVIEVEALLAVVGEPGETWQPESPGDSGDAAPIVGTLEEAPIVATAHSGRVEALPKVRRLAAELGVELALVSGTGPGGRVTEDDVRGAATADDADVARVKMSPTRKAIAARLSRSWREIPHVTIYDSADAESLLVRRTELGKPVLEALLIAAVTPLLAEYPEFNAAATDEEVLYKKRHDIGVAVDTPAGLVVAVVRDPAAVSVAEIDAEVRRLAAGARDRTLTPDELRGQTFTISNIGAVGGGYGTPIVPLGTSAILSVGRADPIPVVRDGEIVARRVFPLTISYDHRIIDGALGRAFMTAVIAALEVPQ